VKSSHQPAQQQLHPPPAIEMDEDIIGAIKIKDGLFIGDEFSAQVRPRLNKLTGS
jgi:hypothetical protein